MEAAADRRLWAKSYDRELVDILALHSEVARSIVDEVRVQLTPAEGSRLASRPPVNAQAYETYLKARYFANRIGPNSARNAADYFRQAAEIDPTYAPSFSGLATALVFTANIGIRPSAELMPQARTAAQRALHSIRTLLNCTRLSRMCACSTSTIGRARDVSSSSAQI